MMRFCFSGLWLLSVACGSSPRAPAPEATATAPGTAAATAAAPATGPEIRAVALTAADAERRTRVDACMELGVFEEGHNDACEPGAFEGSRATKVAAPWTSAEVVRLNAGGEHDSTACALIVTVDEAAFVARDWLAFCDDDDKALAHASWSLADVVPGGAPELVLELTRDEQEIIDSVRTPSASWTYRAWCGIGPSGAPSCTPPVELAQAKTSRPTFP